MNAQMKAGRGSDDPARQTYGDNMTDPQFSRNAALTTSNNRHYARNAEGGGGGPGK